MRCPKCGNSDDRKFTNQDSAPDDPWWTCDACGYVGFETEFDPDDPYVAERAHVNEGVSTGEADSGIQYAIFRCPACGQGDQDKFVSRWTIWDTDDNSTFCTKCGYSGLTKDFDTGEIREEVGAHNMSSFAGGPNAGHGNSQLGSDFPKRWLGKPQKRVKPGQMKETFESDPILPCPKCGSGQSTYPKIVAGYVECKNCGHVYKEFSESVSDDAKYPAQAAIQSVKYFTTPEDSMDDTSQGACDCGNLADHTKDCCKDTGLVTESVDLFPKDTRKTYVVEGEDVKGRARRFLVKADSEWEAANEAKIKRVIPLVVKELAVTTDPDYTSGEQNLAGEEPEPKVNKGVGKLPGGHPDGDEAGIENAAQVTEGYCTDCGHSDIDFDSHDNCPHCGSPNVVDDDDSLDEAETDDTPSAEELAAKRKKLGRRFYAEDVETSKGTYKGVNHCSQCSFVGLDNELEDGLCPTCGSDELERHMAGPASREFVGMAEAKKRRAGQFGRALKNAMPKTLGGKGGDNAGKKKSVKEEKDMFRCPQCNSDNWEMLGPKPSGKYDFHCLDCNFEEQSDQIPEFYTESKKIVKEDTEGFSGVFNDDNCEFCGAFGAKNPQNGVCLACGFDPENPVKPGPLTFREAEETEKYQIVNPSTGKAAFPIKFNSRQEAFAHLKTVKGGTDLSVEKIHVNVAKAVADQAYGTKTESVDPIDEFLPSSMREQINEDHQEINADEFIPESMKNPVKEDMTPGLAKALKSVGGSDYKCSGCGYNMPKYPGAYPKTCPHCGLEITKPQKSEVTDKDEEVKKVTEEKKEGLLAEMGVDELIQKAEPVPAEVMYSRGSK